MPLDDERPESFLGLLMGLEGVADGYTILHGPTGCKYYPASASEAAYRCRTGSAVSRNVFRFGDEYFFGQPRIPCTYLDMGKFVTGGADRLKDVYAKIRGMSPSLISVVNSPGASLIGEDLAVLKGDIPTVAVDHARYSGTAAEGFQDAVGAITDVVVPEQGERHGVNLVGLSILHLGWKDTAADLTHLLSLCGIEVNCVIGAGWSVEDIRRSADAELNALVHPEWGEDTAKGYKDRFGVPYVASPEGAPVGFDSLEGWVECVCDALGKDPSPALGKIADGRGRAASAMLAMESAHLLPRGRTFSVLADGSTAYALSRFLYSYLGMVPVAVRCPNGKEWGGRAVEYFDSLGIPVGDDPENTGADVILSSASIGSSAVSRGVAQGSVDVEAPGLSFVHVDPCPGIGLGGTTRIVDGVLNVIANRQRFR